MANAMAMIMAGGSSPSMSILTEIRSEPAVHFGGKFRIIDFSLSNCVNSDIYNVAILTQYKPRSLNDHIGIGKPWDLDRATGGVRLLQPYTGGAYGGWQQGTADAVRRNLDFVEMQNEDHVLILAGDHIYLMDYRPMIKQHIQNNAEVTLAVRRVNPHETHRFGIVSVGPDDRLQAFQEKPKRTKETLASMGVYIFRKDVLMEILEGTSHKDFGKDVVPAMLADKRSIYTYTVPGYWADVGTVQAYWEANMSLLAEDPALNMYDPNWIIHTKSEERAPVKIGPNASVDGNLISNGCRVEGEVMRSVLSPGVHVAEGAIVRDSVILNDVSIGAGAVIDRCIVDKGVVIGAEAKLGHGDDNKPNGEMPDKLNTGITLVGKNCVVPNGIEIGRNVVIHPESGEKAFGKRKKIKSGSSMGKDQR